jgi:hypothetical protein
VRNSNSAPRGGASTGKKVEVDLGGKVSGDFVLLAGAGVPALDGLVAPGPLHAERTRMKPKNKTTAERENKIIWRPPGYVIAGRFDNADSYISGFLDILCPKIG